VSFSAPAGSVAALTAATPPMQAREALRMRVPPQVLLSLALFAAAPAYAAEALATASNTAAAPGAQPSAGSAQIAFVSGNVAIYQLGQSDWARAAVDLPIASGAWLATDPQARAEIRLGADALAIANSTELNFANLRGQSRQIALSSGRIDVRVDQPARNPSDEIDIPGGAVWLNAPGAYDVSVGREGHPTRIAVFEGTARFAGGGLDQTIPAGNTLVLRKSGANLTGSVERATPDEFVKW
jgi:hypothetical protein